MSTQNKGYELWLWIELIGFDNEQADYGVKAYLDNAGIVPDAVSLFVFNPEFVHCHDGMSEDRTFPIDVATYGGHPSGYERERQDWTKFQLKGLVDELHRHGIEVFFSIMDIFATQEWLAEHPEVLHVTRDGQRMGSVCGWKRLSDGTYYEDFFARQVGRVLADYEFDGYHQADGYCHPRISLYQGDYSDDMIDQFVSATGVALPEGMGEASGDRPEVIAARAEWIWRHKRTEWIDFYRERFATFCRKVAEAVHAEGKRVVLNNALTRDPFEAMYRYGVDYKRLKEAGVDGFIAETVSPGVTLGAESGMEANPHYDYLAMLLTLKAYVGDLPVLCLNGVHDVNEQWDVLRHGPPLLEREIQCQSNLYRWRADGALERCSAGPVVCLADGLQRHEWGWLREWWGLAFEEAPKRVVGATLVWSDQALERQLGEFIRTRRWTTHKLLHELTARGAPVYSAADVKDLGGVEGPLLVLNPQLFPERELVAILAYERGPIVVIGGKADGLPKAEVEFEDGYAPGQLYCAAFGVKGDYGASIVADSEETIPDDLMGVAEPPFFVQELYFRKVSDGFLAECARVIADAAGAVKVLRRPDAIRVQAMEMGGGRMRLLVGNDSHYYVVTELDVGKEIESIHARTAYPRVEPVAAGSRFGVKVPGKGVVVLDVVVKE